MVDRKASRESVLANFTDRLNEKEMAVRAVCEVQME